jgi:predicted DNA-binding transcriptional regulator AlpA
METLMMGDKMSIAIDAPPQYLTISQVCEIVPGMTKGILAQLRFKGTGPRYYKPTPRVVLYREADIVEWIENSARTGTAEGR